MKMIFKNALFFLLFFYVTSGYGQAIELQADSAAVQPAPSSDSVMNQPDTLHQKIYKCKVLNKGFYLNKDEFFNNAPSITRNFEVEEKNVTRKQKESGIMKVKYTLLDGTKTVGKKVWGFCDGKNVYVQILGDFWKLDCVGPYPYAVYPLKQFGATSVAGIIMEESFPSYEIFLMDKKGRFNRSYSEDLLELFDQEHDIKYAFRKALGPDIHEPNLQRASITRTYLKKFNERLIEKE